MVELVALLPVFVLLGLVAWQFAATGYAWTLAESAARAASRAHEVGAPAGPAARAVLPAGYATGARAVVVDDARHGAVVRVRLAIPRILPMVPAPGHVTAEAALDGPR
jgi:hypothetical protein